MPAVFLWLPPPLWGRVGVGGGKRYPPPRPSPTRGEGEKRKTTEMNREARATDYRSAFRSDSLSSRMKLQPRAHSCSGRRVLCTTQARMVRAEWWEVFSRFRLNSDPVGTGRSTRR